MLMRPLLLPACLCPLVVVAEFCTRRPGKCTGRAEFLSQRLGEESPFQGVNVAKPHAVDWDNDGDLDLVVGNKDGEGLLYERLASGAFAQRLGEESPFHENQQG